MTTEFSEVVAALGRPVEAAAAPGQPRRVTVLGAGPEGRALAAWLLAEGTPEVNLFTVYADELAILAAGSVTLRGDGPIGTFRTGDGGIEVTSVLDAAVADSDVLFVTGPVFKLRTYGMVLAPYLNEKQTLVVCPAQTFGGLEVDWWLAAGGRTDASVMIEMGTRSLRLPTNRRGPSPPPTTRRRRWGTAGTSHRHPRLASRHIPRPGAPIDDSARIVRRRQRTGRSACPDFGRAGCRWWGAVLCCRARCRSPPGPSVN